MSHSKIQLRKQLDGLTTNTITVIDNFDDVGKEQFSMLALQALEIKYKYGCAETEK